MFMEDPPELFIVHSSGMAPVAARENIYFGHNYSIVSMFKIMSHSHKKLNDCIPQRPEVDIEHCDEVS